MAGPAERKDLPDSSAQLVCQHGSRICYQGSGDRRSLFESPEKALVISVDEKPSMQALERATGYVETASGKIVRGFKSTYKRHGTLNLFAALEVPPVPFIRRLQNLNVALSSWSSWIV